MHKLFKKVMAALLTTAVIIGFFWVNTAINAQKYPVIEIVSDPALQFKSVEKFSETQGLQFGQWAF